MKHPISVLWVAALFLAIGTPSADAQQVVWRPSRIETIGNDSAHWIEQATIESPAQPVVGQRFYVRMTFWGLDSLNPRFILMTFYPPDGVSLAVDAANPVRCIYFDRDDSGRRGEFTHEVYYDRTFPEEPFRVYGCPQPPFRLTEVGYLFDRRDPLLDGNLWRVPALATYEMYIPLVASRPLDPTDVGSTFFARFESGWGTAVATLGLQVHPPANGADLRGHLELGQSERAGYTKVIASCINDGPSAAIDASCVFSIVPPDADISCTPASPAAQLPALSTITCTAEFRTRTSATTVAMDAFSQSPDWNRGNNAAFLNVPFVASTADLATSTAIVAAAPGWARVVGQCTNAGPDAAVRARCFFPADYLPEGAVVGCSPTPIPDPMGVNATFVCAADFVIPVSDTFVLFDATTDSHDPTRANSSHVTVPGASADMDATLAMGTGAPLGSLRVIGRCTNTGSGGAAQASCDFGPLPAGASVNCMTPSPVDLAVDGFIECSAEFPAPAAEFDIALDAGALTHDPDAANNSANLRIAPAADLQASLALGPGSASHTRLEGVCTNLGPSPASEVTCAFSGLPDATVTCTPPGRQETLAAGASIHCSAEFENRSQALSVTLAATSATADPTAANDAFALSVPPQTGGRILRNGFESD